MNMNRRFFLSGTIVVAAAAVIKPHKSAVLPRIYADGVRDDWAGLDALLNGRPAEVEGGVLRVTTGQHVNIEGGYFRISRSLFMRSHAAAPASITILDSTFDVLPEWFENSGSDAETGDAGLAVRFIATIDRNDVTISRNCFVTMTDAEKLRQGYVPRVGADSRRLLS